MKAIKASLETLRDKNTVTFNLPTLKLQRDISNPMLPSNQISKINSMANT